MIVKDENAMKASELMDYYRNWYWKSIEEIEYNRKIGLVSQDDCDEMLSWVNSIYKATFKMYHTFIPVEV